MVAEGVLRLYAVTGVGGGWSERRILPQEKEVKGKGAKTTQVIHCERDKGDVISIERRNDGFRGGG
jgi:hypothetical protein